MEIGRHRSLNTLPILWDSMILSHFKNMLKYKIWLKYWLTAQSEREIRHDFNQANRNIVEIVNIFIMFILKAQKVCMIILYYMGMDNSWDSNLRPLKGEKILKSTMSTAEIQDFGFLWSW